MKGTDLKDKLISLGYTMTYIAEKLDIAPQNMNSWFRADDVRSGTIEKLAKVLDIPVSYFYGETAGSIQTVSGSNNTSVAGNSNTVGMANDILLQLLKSKDDQLTRSQLQIDELLKIIAKGV